MYALEFNKSVIIEYKSIDVKKTSSESVTAVKWKSPMKNKWKQMRIINIDKTAGECSLYRYNISCISQQHSVLHHYTVDSALCASH